MSVAPTGHGRVQRGSPQGEATRGRAITVLEATRWNPTRIATPSCARNEHIARRPPFHAHPAYPWTKTQIRILRTHTNAPPLPLGPHSGADVGAVCELLSGLYLVLPGRYAPLYLCLPLCAVYPQGLVEALTSAGCVLLCTSNRAPGELPRHGLHEDVWAHFIQTCVGHFAHVHMLAVPALFTTRHTTSHAGPH